MLKAVTIEPILKVTDLYTLYYFQHKSGYRFEGESHDFWEIIYVDHGRASGLNGSEPYELKKGQMIFHHPNVFHNFRTGVMTDEVDEDCDIIVISFGGNLEVLEQFRDHIFTLSIYERNIFKQILDEGKQVYNKTNGKNLIYKKRKSIRTGKGSRCKTDDWKSVGTIITFSLSETERMSISGAGTAASITWDGVSDGAADYFVLGTESLQ